MKVFYSQGLPPPPLWIKTKPSIYRLQLLIVGEGRGGQPHRKVKHVGLGSSHHISDLLQSDDAGFWNSKHPLSSSFLTFIFLVEGNHFLAMEFQQLLWC